MSLRLWMQENTGLNVKILMKANTGLNVKILMKASLSEKYIQNMSNLASHKVV